MHFFLYFLLYFGQISQFFSKQVVIQCPSHCKCDIFENFKRATCAYGKLVMLESYLPTETEILDLSYNQIAQLDDHVFIEEKLLSLKLLNISHNKVSQIHMNAFDGLNQLKTLDLSYNAIQYLIIHWFWSLESLEEIYLRGNYFTQINDEPLFDSKTLKKLDLSKCKISYLGNDALVKLPNLQYLDISENYLIHFDTIIIKPLMNLQILRINNNSLICDEVMRNLSKYCAQKGIRFQDPCLPKTNITSENFQRMVSLVEPEDEKNSWIFDDEETKTKTIMKIVQYCNNTNDNFLKEVVDLSPILSILIPFIYGIAVGMVIGCTVQINTGRRKRDNNENTYRSFDDGDTHLSRRSLRPRTHSNRFNRTQNSEERENLPLKEWTLSESTPVLNRKSQLIA